MAYVGRYPTTRQSIDLDGIFPTVRPFNKRPMFLIINSYIYSISKTAGALTSLPLSLSKPSPPCNIVSDTM